MAEKLVKKCCSKGQRLGILTCELLGKISVRKSDGLGIPIINAAIGPRIIPQVFN